MYSVYNTARTENTLKSVETNVHTVKLSDKMCCLWSHIRPRITDFVSTFLFCLLDDIHPYVSLKDFIHSKFKLKIYWGTAHV